jgi:hypothetical protein
LRAPLTPHASGLNKHAWNLFGGANSAESVRAEYPFAVGACANVPRRDGVPVLKKIIAENHVICSHATRTSFAEAKWSAAHIKQKFFNATLIGLATISQTW